MGALHRLFLILILRGGARTLVERVDNIGAEPVLDFYRALGSKPVQSPVDMRGKGTPFFVYDGELAVRSGHLFVENSHRLFGRGLLRQELRNLFAEPLSERKYLEPARVGHDGAVKAHKRVDAARAGNELRPGREIQVVGIGDDGLYPERVKLGHFYALNVGLGAHRNKRGGLYVAVRRRKNSRPGKAGTLFLYIERII